MPPVVVQGLDGKLISCWIALSGCDFEVLINEDVPIAFRRADVCVVMAGYLDVATGSAAVDMDYPLWKMMPRSEFNAQLLDNMMIALRGVTGKGDIVATSRHFTAVMAKAIEKLEDLSTRVKDPAVVDEINDVKLDIFRHLMSQDLRK